MPPESAAPTNQPDPPALAAPLLLTDYVPSGGFVVEPDDVWSCSQPDAQGRVRAIVRVGSVLLRVEGRRIFHV